MNFRGNKAVESSRIKLGLGSGRGEKKTVYPPTKNVQSTPDKRVAPELWPVPWRIVAEGDEGIAITFGISPFKKENAV